jgi:hypothetical protein
MKETDEITYDQAAEFLDCSPRHLRRVLKRQGIEPIRRGYRTVRLKAAKIFWLKFKLATLPKPEIFVHGMKYKLMRLTPAVRSKKKGSR